MPLSNEQLERYHREGYLVATSIIPEQFTCPGILDVMEQLIGPEIVASSIYRIRPSASIGICPSCDKASAFPNDRQ